MEKDLEIQINALSGKFLCSKDPNEGNRESIAREISNRFMASWDEIRQLLSTN